MYNLKMVIQLSQKKGFQLAELVRFEEIVVHAAKLARWEFDCACAAVRLKGTGMEKSKPSFEEFKERTIYYIREAVEKPLERSLDSYPEKPRGFKEYINDNIKEIDNYEKKIREVYETLKF